MAFDDTTLTKTADDGFEDFYAEKIWRLIPGIYRDEDAKTKTPDALRAFVEVLARQAAKERRSIDRIWADAHITDCDDWAIPYIADLLGTRLISAQNINGRRADVANTIKYRRRAGTKYLLSALVDDIAGWDAVVSEAFKRLFRTWHRLDCPPVIGPITGTPQHGLARISSSRIGEIADTGFDDLAHLPDFRQLRGKSGRYNIPKINLHIYRQYAFLMRGVTPHRFDETRYTLDPSGRDIPLFKPGEPISDECQTKKEWQVRGPLICGLLNDAKYAPNAQAAAGSIGPGLLDVEGEVFNSAAALIRRAVSMNSGTALTDLEGAQLLLHSLLASSAKANLINDALSLAYGTDPVTDIFATSELFGGNLQTWQTTPPTPWDWVRGLVDPSNGRVFLPNIPAVDDPNNELFSLRYHYGAFAPVGAGSHDRQSDIVQEDVDPLPDPTPDPNDPAAFTDFVFPTDGIHQINDSRTYIYEATTGLTVTDDLTVQAANAERPYITIAVDAAGPGLETRWEVDASEDGRTLVLDGLWLGFYETGQTTVADGSAAPMSISLVLTGNFETVTLRNMTLDPGGRRARVQDGFTFVIPAVTLKLEGAIDTLILDHCITGPIEEASTLTDICAANRICIQDCIVKGPPNGSAITCRSATLEMTRTTVFGKLSAARFLIENSLIKGEVIAQDPQASCFRYSAAVETPEHGIPNAYRSVAYPSKMPNHLFVSRRFGDPGFAQLSKTAPESLRRGAENTSEMGAYNSTIDAIKRDDLIYKLSEFTGINTITQLIFET